MKPREERAEGKRNWWQVFGKKELAPELPGDLEVQSAPEAARETAPPVGPTALPDTAAPERKPGLFARLKQGLARTSSGLVGGIAQVFTTRKIDEETLGELEELLIGADLGVSAAARITEALRKSRVGTKATEEEIRTVLAGEIEQALGPSQGALEFGTGVKPFVILVVGVNGTGKTTTIGKLAQLFKGNGKSVMMAAGDTFRAAAVEQLKVWGARTNCPVVARETGADSAGLAYDALAQARAEGVDILMIDTAGRLQNKATLMAELEKLIRVLKKLDPAAPHSVIQVLDATTGQNAISQVEVFQKTAGVTGRIRTKRDGTARGGIRVPLAERCGLPIHAIGVGEAAEDLQPFNARQFARALVGLEEAAPAL